MLAFAMRSDMTLTKLLQGSHAILTWFIRGAGHKKNGPAARSTKSGGAGFGPRHAAVERALKAKPRLMQGLPLLQAVHLAHQRRADPRLAQGMTGLGHEDQFRLRPRIM